ncbi:hypothetical protein L2725_08720 [Shewanella corallii]|uniref:Uncharacterized protein n=1 Tax=Shewanella corallii TaxID=560080 RepID=A0ABT0N667_9GAMM|nr:hypothetical protein [Shewanella corallii]MCL2913875.1 hypothetical protein [Shewanella corallii]
MKVPFACSVLLFATLVINSAPSHATDTDAAVEAFQQATADILEEGRENGQKYSELIQEMGDLMAASESARVALKSGNAGTLESLARSNVSLGKKYVAEYRKFLRNVAPNSSCARQPQTRRMLEQVEELALAANNIAPLAATQDEMEAYAAFMELNKYQVLVASVPNMFEAAQLCVVQDGLPALVEGMQELEALLGNTVANGELDANTLPQQAPEYPQPGEDNWIKPSEHIVEQVSFYPDQIPSFNDLSIVYAENRDQLTQLRFSNGLSIDDNLMLVLPPSAGANGYYSASITGTVETQDYIATLHIRIERLASKPIAGFSGVTDSLKTCIDTSAKQQMAEYAHQLEVINCGLPAGEFVSLEALSEMPNLTMVALSGGKLGPLTPLGNLPELSNLTLVQSDIPRFGDLSGIKAVMQFSKVRSQDWIALASANTDSIMMEQIPDCSSLDQLARAPEVAFLLGKPSAGELNEYLRQLDAGEKRIGIIASCSE